MNNVRIQQLLDQIATLENELRVAVHEQEHRIYFHIRGKKIEFEKKVHDAHRKMRTSLFQWLTTNRPLNLITGPIIYGMVVPLLLVDICVSFYQFSCFPIYKIQKVKREDYIVLDRQKLAYLNFIEKFHCTYCAYGSGLIAYVSEIVARTEQYFCPIKHARKILGTHSRYQGFLNYGDATDYQARANELRSALEAKNES
ncbi:MAG TPA: hypothetical protein VL381_07905 [Rhodocyclaceae bacterium]|nr:hypothetical protein [Rhodocyclaceae bacterium]